MCVYGHVCMYVYLYVHKHVKAWIFVHPLKSILKDRYSLKPSISRTCGRGTTVSHVTSLWSCKGQDLHGTEDVPWQNDSTPPEFRSTLGWERGEWQLVRIICESESEVG